MIINDSPRFKMNRHIQLKDIECGTLYLVINATSFKISNITITH